MSFKKLLKKTACATLTAALALCSPLMASANPVYDIADDAGFLTDSFSPDDNFTDNEVIRLTEETASDELYEESDFEISDRLRLDDGITSSEGIEVPTGATEDGYFVYRLTSDYLTTPTFNGKKATVTSQIQKILNEARDHATAELPYKIIIAPGTYEISGGALHIYSNTHFFMESVTFLRSGSGNIMVVGTKSDNAPGYYYKNITLDGGTGGAVFDQNSNTVSTTLKVGHAENFLMKNFTLKNTIDGHFMEVAGVNGFTLQNCSFQNQTLVSKAYYEAVQFDILEKDHISGYVYEILPNQNILIDGCRFSRVARGVGSHNSVLNCPMTNIKIQNCTFSDLTSAAIQMTDVSGFTAERNTFTNVPRAISLYAPRTNSTFLPSTIDKYNTAYSDAYQVPAANQNITISGNSIDISGEDAYNKDYEKSGIFITGYIQTTQKAPENNDGDTLPAGNYFISGVTIAGNTITTHQGNGIILYDVQNATVTSNTGNYNDTADKAYRGILVGNSSSSVVVSQNQINYFPSAGIECTDSSGVQVLNNNIFPAADGILIANSKQCAINSNSISNMRTFSPYQNGAICLTRGSVANSITGNNISDFIGDAIVIKDISQAVTVSSNNITASKGTGIYVAASMAASIKDNYIGKACIDKKDYGAICLGAGATVTKLEKNTVDAPYAFGIQVNEASVETIANNTVKKPVNYGILIYNRANVKKLDKNSVTNGSSLGIHIENTSGELTVSSNTVTKCGTAQIFVNRKDDSPCVTLTGNKVTGTAKTDGIRVDAGVVDISANKLTGCRYAIFLRNSGIKADVGSNTYKNNKYNSTKYKNTGKTKYTAYANLKTPTSVKAIATGKKTMQIKWKSVSKASGYEIYRSKKKNSGYKLVGTVSSKKTVFNDKKLKKKTKYYYKVVACRKSADKKVTIRSNESKVVSKKTLSK